MEEELGEEGSRAKGSSRCAAGRWQAASSGGEAGTGQAKARRMVGGRHMRKWYRW